MSGRSAIYGRHYSYQRQHPGSAEYVAEHLAEKLEEAGYSTEIQHGPLVDDLPKGSGWLSLPPTAPATFPTTWFSFYDALQEQQADLSAVRFGAIGIGSREYDTFCGAIDKLEAALLKACGAKQIGETLKINVLEHEIPEDPAEIWLILEKFALIIVKIVRSSVDNHA